MNKVLIAHHFGKCTGDWLQFLLSCDLYFFWHASTSDMKMSRFHLGHDSFYCPHKQLLSAAGTNWLFIISSTFHSCSYEFPRLNQDYSIWRGKWERGTDHAILLQKWRFLWWSNMLSDGGEEGPNNSSSWRINAPRRHPEMSACHL